MARKMKMAPALIWLGGTLFVVYLNTFIVWLRPDAKLVGLWCCRRVGSGFRKLPLPDYTERGTRSGEK